jgi:hypothetical protein
MNISDLAEDYLVDPKEAMRKLTAAYLNEVLRVRGQSVCEILSGLHSKAAFATNY